MNDWRETHIWASAYVSRRDALRHMYCVLHLCPWIGRPLAVLLSKWNMGL